MIPTIEIYGNTPWWQWVTYDYYTPLGAERHDAPIINFKPTVNRQMIRIAKI